MTPLRPWRVVLLAAIVALGACGKESPPPPAPTSPAPAASTATPAGTPAAPAASGATPSGSTAASAATPAPAASAPTASPQATPAAAGGAPAGGSPAGGTSSAANTGAAATAQAAARPLKAAWVYVGPVGDGGWTFAHDNGRKAAAAALGDKVSTSYVESVPESADAERVLRDLAEQGNDVIFGTTFGYMNAMLKLAREYPSIRFEHATGYKTAENLRTYDSRTYQGAYMAGVIAGRMTSSNTLGVVGSIPIPEVLRNINAFTLGARSVNPQATTRVVWVNKWFDPPRESEAAQALLDQGADVLFQNTDSSAVLQTAEKAGKYAFGWDSDMSHYGPKAHLASAVINWGPYYTKALKDVLEGTWTTGSSWWGVAEGAIDIVSIGDMVPAETRERVATIRQGLADGSFKVWRGPITDNTGTVRIPEGETADDAFLGGLNFYVQGVEGTVPSGK